MSWGWESFPEYLDLLDERQWTMDVGTQVPHAALRAYVMGERGADHVERASAAEIAQMRSLCAASIRAGAMGFASSRTTAHRTSTGQIIGTLTASTDEVLGIIGGLSDVGKGVVQLISDVYHTSDTELAAAELKLLSRIALESKRPMSFSVQQYDETPDRYRELLAAIDGWCAQGANAKAQVAVRPIGVLIGLTASANPLNHCPSYRKQIRLLPLEQQLVLLRQADVRQRLLAEHAGAAPKGFQQIIHSRFDRMYPLTEPLDYEPIVQNSVAGVAASSGRPAIDVLYDLLLADNGKQLLYIPLLNYARGSLDDVYEMLKAPNALIGLSDAGAHCTAISDGSMPTTALTHWTRDRTRGPLISLEHMVHLQTQKTAAHVGWRDRGVIAPGYLADLNLIDMQALSSRAPHLVADLPAGGTRLMQEASGYKATIKSGVVTAADGILTGERPGRLQRGGKRHGMKV